MTSFFDVPIVPRELFCDRLPKLTPLEQQAWEIYCRENFINARDFWWDLSPYVQNYYLERARNA
jgi:hypothetical protein